MIRPDDLSVAAVAANAAPDAPAQTLGHAAGIAADSLTQAATAFPQVDPLSAAERASTLGGWVGNWSARPAGAWTETAQATAAELFSAASTRSEEHTSELQSP